MIAGCFIMANWALVNFCQTERRNVPKDRHIHTRRLENLKSHTVNIVETCETLCNGLTAMFQICCVPLRFWCHFYMWECYDLRSYKLPFWFTLNNFVEKEGPLSECLFITFENIWNLFIWFALVCVWFIFWLSRCWSSYIFSVLRCPAF